MAHPSEINTETDYQRTVEVLRSAAAAYYTGDGIETIGMTDADYDALLEDVRHIEQAHPDWTVDHGLDRVAAGTGGTGDVPHSVPMLSLGKVTAADGLRSWWDRTASSLAAADDQLEVVVEPKLDGIAISAVYVDGRLHQVITRGDGQVGEDVTDRIPTGTVGLPREINQTHLTVRGELVFSTDQFQAANAYRVAEGKAPFVNPRNALAGSVRRDDIPAAERPAMTFLAYAAVVSEHHGRLMLGLADLGFVPALHLAAEVVGPVVLDSAGTLDEVAERIALIGEKRLTFPYALDGAVIKVDSVRSRSLLGETSAHPRWAVAWKYPAEEASTTLLDIEVQVGRTGIHSLRGRLEPVFVGGTTVTYATLHNPSDLAARDVRPGDTVVVRRAGDVIPEIAGHIARPSDSVPWVMPTDCVECGSELDQSEKRWRCVNRDCIAGAGALLVYACSRDALDIEGAGEGAIGTIVGANLTHTLPGLATITVADLVGLDGFAQTSASTLVANIAAAKTRPLHRLVTALGIRMTGRRLSKRIAAHFGTLDAIRSATVTELCEVEGIGARRAETIRAELDAIAGLLDQLVAQGWNTVDENYGAAPTDIGDLPLAGEKVVVTGAVPGYGRNEVNDLIERLGGKSSGSVSKATTLLISDGPGSSKHTKAEELGVRIESPEWLVSLVAG